MNAFCLWGLFLLLLAFALSKALTVLLITSQKDKNGESLLDGRPRKNALPPP